MGKKRVHQVAPNQLPIVLNNWLQVTINDEGYTVQRTTDEIVQSGSGVAQRVLNAAVVDRAELHTRLDEFLNEHSELILAPGEA